jgi:protein phosphatase 1 regulatory subunit 10
VCYIIASRILEKGGWATLHTWFQQCRSEDGNAFLYELLLLYKHVPVSVELLRQNSCAKDIKQLIKSSDDSGFLME